MRWRWLVLSPPAEHVRRQRDYPGPPTTSPTTTFTPAPNQPVVTITATGVSPQQVEIAVGGA